MILRRGVFTCIRNKPCSCRFISLSAFKSNDGRKKNLPSRKIFEELTEREYLSDQIIRSGRRPFEIMLEKPIVVKSFFVSNLDDEDIQYPEIVSVNELDNWKKINANISKYFSQHIKNSENGFHPSVYQAFKEFNLFGYNVPKRFGGQELSYTQQMFVSEAEAQNIAAAMILNAHRLVCTAIKEIGTDEQCRELLPKLANGDLIGTLAFEEVNAIDNVEYNTHAEYNDDEEQWCLNGKKSFVINAADANLFLVIAKTQTSDRKGDMKNTLSVFIVDGSLPGIEIHEKDKTIGCPSLYQAAVSFKDVILSNDSLLSIPGTGNYIRERVQIHSRFSHGLLNLSQMKYILQYIMSMAESIEQVSETDSQKTEAKTLRHIIGKYTCSIYELESMLYLTTGIMDKYHNTNIDLESAIFKIHSQDQLLNMMMEVMSCVDTRLTLSDHILNQFIRNAVQLKFNEPTNDLKYHIGKTGLSYRLNRLIEEVAVNKNQKFVIKNFLTPAQLEKYEAELGTTAKAVFESIDMLRLGASVLFDTASLPTQRHIELMKLADAAACIYASFACLLRSDQSLKLKLPNAHDEIAIAQTICDRNIKKTVALVKYIEDSPVKTFDKFHLLMTDMLLKKITDFPVHPLTRFF